jgi:hypothetical protein
MPILRALKFLFKPILNDVEEIRRLDKIIIENQRFETAKAKEKISMISKNDHFKSSGYLEDAMHSTRSYARLSDLKGKALDLGDNDLAKEISKKMNSIQEKKLLKELLDELKNKPTSYIEDLIDIV